MKPIITALEIQVEHSVFTDDNKLLSRPRVAPLVVFQSEIPDDVLAWVRGLLEKRGQ
jgi:hypothetical protein